MNQDTSKAFALCYVVSRFGLPIACILAYVQGTGAETAECYFLEATTGCIGLRGHLLRWGDIE